MAVFDQYKDDHIAVYGPDNHMRLTGLHETQAIDQFNYGLADRGASVRVPHSFVNNGHRAIWRIAARTRSATPTGSPAASCRRSRRFRRATTPRRSSSSSRRRSPSCPACTNRRVPSLSTYAVFVVTCLALLAIPGPAVLYIVSRSIDQGRTAGLLSALGVTTGTLVHIAAAAIGLSSLVLASTVAFGVVRYAGAAYLVFLGVRRLLTRDADTLVEERAPRSLRRLYTQGVIVNLLNPKTIVFIFAFLPQFVDVDAGHVGVQIVLLGLTLAGLGLMSDSLYAIVAGSIADRLRGSRAVARFERWFGGGILVGLGLAAAVVAPNRST